MFKLYMKCWSILNANKKRNVLNLIALMLITSFAEVISIGLLMPFLSLLASPEQTLEYTAVVGVMEYFNVHFSSSDLIFYSTLILVISALVAAGLRISLLWNQTRLAHGIGADLSQGSYYSVLHQSYIKHIQRNSSEIISIITEKSRRIVYDLFMPMLQIISSLIFLVAVLGFLLLINPLMVFAGFGSVAAIYLIIAKILKNRINNYGEIISNESSKVIKIAQEGLGGIREIIINGKQLEFSGIYNQRDQKLRKVQAQLQFLSGLPRFVIEATSISVIAIIAAVLTGDDENMVPLLGVIALAGQRLLPTMQQIYYSWASIKGTEACFSDVLEIIDYDKEKIPQVDESINFDSTIDLHNISFSYSNQKADVLKNVSMKIKKGSKIGIIGESGSGKSTLLDIILGLFHPVTGSIKVDSKDLNPSTMIAWRKKVSHVSQNIYLADSSIAENIAFGVPIEEIDWNRVVESAKIAQISEFIENMPKKYMTQAGERGVWFSGGQLQRIGIARALYKNVELMILDEATSALDIETERKVIEALGNFRNDLTILMVAHRYSTLSNCDFVYKLDNGVITDISSERLLHGIK